MTSKKYSIKVDMEYTYLPKTQEVDLVLVRVYAVTSPHWLARLFGEKPQEIENTSLDSLVGPAPSHERIADTIYCLEEELLDFMDTQRYVEV